MIPSVVFKHTESVDPSDVTDHLIDLTPLLEAEESFASIVFTIVAESAALGFKILTEAPYAPVEESDSTVRIWVTVEDASRDAAVWSKGTDCAIEFTATTDNTPPRIFQRTVAVQVIQR